MSVMGFNPVASAPSLPLLLELRSVIGQYRLRMPPLPLQQGSHLLGSRIVVKLLRRHQEPAVVVDAHQKPVFPAMHRERPLEVDLPELVGRLRPEEPPSLVVMRVAVQPMSGEDVVYGFPGQTDSLYAAHRLRDEAWKVEEALLYARGSPFEGVSQREDGDLDLVCDLAWFGAPCFVLVVFSADVFGAFQPPVNGLFVVSRRSAILVTMSPFLISSRRVPSCWVPTSRCHPVNDYELHP